MWNSEKKQNSACLGIKECVRKLFGLSPGTLQSHVLYNKRNHCNEKPAHCSWKVAPACHNRRASTSSPRAAMKTQHSQK